MTDPRIGGDPEPDTDDTIGAAVDDYDLDGEFDLDRLYAETRADPYPFRWAGQRWELPNVYDLPTNILDVMGKADLDTSDIRRTLESAFGPEQWKAIQAERPLPIRATVDLFNRWLKWCGVDVGEASSSAASSNGTAGRSKRTSSGGTASTSARRSTAGRKTGSRRASSSA
jgi:hypothetical protein